MREETLRVRVIVRVRAGLEPLKVWVCAAGWNVHLLTFFLSVKDLSETLN